MRRTLYAMSEDDEWVELLRTGDPLRAEMIRELLESEDVPVATPGLEHRAMLGVIGGHVAIVVQVPRADVARAREALDALDAAPLDGLEVTSEDARPERVNVDYRTSARGPSTVGGKRRRVVPIAALFIPGGGHVYVAEWRSAAVVALTQIAVLAALVFGVPYAGLFIPLVVLADIAGGTWHCDRLARGEAPPGVARRFAPELVAVAAATWIGLQIGGPAAAWTAGPRATLLCTWAAECNPSVDRRSCLWDASATDFDDAIIPRCASCLRDARDCNDAYECEACWAE
jgi:hypothetical protein